MAIQTKTFDDCLLELVCYNGSLQLAHWRADTKSNEHRALGELYDSLVGLVDTLAEAYMGKNDCLIEFVNDCCLVKLTSPVAEGLTIVEDIESYFDMEEDAELLNITADMRNALNKAKYLLKEK